jgi:hypothetical protein
MTERWMCGSCHSLNDASARSCYKCRTPRATGEFRDASGRAGAPGLNAVAPREPSLIGGILGGVILGTLVTALWIWANFNIGEGILAGRSFYGVSWLVGAAIAFGVVIGGRGRTSFVLVLFSVLLTALALFVGEYLIISRVLAEEAGLDVSKLVIAQPDDIAKALPRIIEDAPLRPVLWAIALLTAWGIPWARLVGPSPDRRVDR